MTTDPGSIRPKSTHPNSTLRAPTREDLYRGGRSLLALLDGMAEQELQGCRFDVLRNRMEMVMIRADGTETPGWGWPVMHAQVTTLPVDPNGALVPVEEIEHGRGGRRVGPKWGRFAATRADALHCAITELLARIAGYDTPQARRIRTWVEGVK